MHDTSKELFDLTVMVARYFDGEPQCVAAAAILVEAGRLLGYELAPRPVSVYAATTDGGAAIATGGPAKRFGMELAESHEEVDGRIWGNDFDQAGHMIVTAERGGWILDPTFAQFSRFGLPYTAIVTTGDVNPANGIIQRGEDDFGVRYWLLDSSVGWKESYSDYLNENRSVAAEIAKLISESRP